MADHQNDPVLSPSLSLLLRLVQQQQQHRYGLVSSLPSISRRHLSDARNLFFPPSLCARGLKDEQNLPSVNYSSSSRIYCTIRIRPSLFSEQVKKNVVFWDFLRVSIYCHDAHILSRLMQHFSYIKFLPKLSSFYTVNILNNVPHFIGQSKHLMSAQRSTCHFEPWQWVRKYNEMKKLKALKSPTLQNVRAQHSPRFISLQQLKSAVFKVHWQVYKKLCRYEPAR